MRMLIRRAGLAVATIACVVPATTATAASFHRLRDPFFHYARPATYGTARTDGARVPLRDGSYLVCTVTRPARAGRPAAGRFPGLVIDYTPYPRFRQVVDRPTARFYASRGYVVVYCDPRGSGASPGFLDPFSVQERQDDYDLIEWLARQPYADGRIGQEGGSYGGHSALMAAVTQPPHLRAILVQSGFSNWYVDSFFLGGVESVAQRGWEQSMRNGDVGPVRLSPVFDTYRQHPLYDAFWRERSVRAHWDKLTVPTLALEGWKDRYKRAMVADFRARRHTSWLVLGSWEHYSTQAGSVAHPFPAGSLGKQPDLAWWDHWLKRLPSAPLPRERVTAMETPDRSGSGWHQYRDWPPPGARTLRLSLNADGTLATAPGRSARQRFRDDGHDRGCDPSMASPCDPHQAAYDRSRRRLTYTTATLRADVVLTGAAHAIVRAAFPSGDGNVVVRLSDVAPDGTVTQLATGWRRAALYRGYDHVETLVPGKVYAIPVDTYPVYYRVAKGHRLRLSVSSGDWPTVMPDANDGTLVTVAAGRGGSFADIRLLAPPRSAIARAQSASRSGRSSSSRIAARNSAASAP